MVTLFGELQATLESSVGGSTGANRAASRRFDPPHVVFMRDSKVDAPPLERVIILALVMNNQVGVVSKLEL